MAWLLAACALPLGCAPAPAAAPPRPGSLSAADQAFLDDLEHRTFRWFWDVSDSTTGLTPDRWPTRSFVSVGAMGFALTSYPIGSERGWITREQARRRTLTTLEFLWNAPMDSASSGSSGYRGFYYHFLHPGSGTRFGQVELSTIDTALLLAGALFCQSYFAGADADERRIRALADSLYFRVDWAWAQTRPPKIVLGWSPEEGFLRWDWGGYNEAMILMVLALGSPTHPAAGDVWGDYTSRYRFDTFHGQEHLGFGPLFGHQYSHVWVDFRGIRDDAMRARASDYFENSRRATLAQRAYAIANPSGFAGYGAEQWGLSACDGPIDSTLSIGGRRREFHTYWARGASFTGVNDDGTLSPSAVGGSLPFAPEVCVPTLVAIAKRHGEAVYNRYGFVDAFNPTLAIGIRTQHGRVSPGVGWYDTDQLGIDQGPILAMAENLRSDLVWRTMRRNPHVVRGLRAAGFRGGWLDTSGRTR